MKNPPNANDANRLSLLALARMAELKIAPTPQNYCLWYEIESGSNPALKLEAEQLVAQGIESIDETRFCELFDRYIGTIDRRDRLDSADAKLSGILELVESMLRDASAGAKGSHQALQDLAQQASGTDILADLRLLVEGLTRESRTMLDNNHILAQRLAQTSQQMESLKANLSSAREDALNDQLTGLSNRKAMEIAIRSVIAQVPEHGVASLLMIDVDHFKSFNDRFGHTVGDEVLKVVARVLKENTKGKDTAARYGGEEFLVLLPGLTLAQANALAEQLRLTVEAKKFRRRATGETLPAVTISVGVSVYRPGEDAGDWIERTDTALYQAKSGGRNIVAAAWDEADQGHRALRAVQ